MEFLGKSVSYSDKLKSAPMGIALVQNKMLARGQEERVNTKKFSPHPPQEREVIM
jgi:hypothetical protein